MGAYIKVFERQDIDECVLFFPARTACVIDSLLLLAATSAPTSSPSSTTSSSTRRTSRTLITAGASSCGSTCRASSTSSGSSRSSGRRGCPTRRASRRASSRSSRAFGRRSTSFPRSAPLCDESSTRRTPRQTRCERCRPSDRSSRANGCVQLEPLFLLLPQVPDPALACSQSPRGSQLRKGDKEVRPLVASSQPAVLADAFPSPAELCRRRSAPRPEGKGGHGLAGPARRRREVGTGRRGREEGPCGPEPAVGGASRRDRAEQGQGASDPTSRVFLYSR